MKERHDPWYVRLPDGRVVKAKSTASVRHHIEAGNIPLNSMARREAHQEWQSLSWIAEFSELNMAGNRSVASAHDMAVPPSSNGSAPDINLKSGISARLDPMRLQTVGIRGLVDELIAAFDSTVSSGKLVAACAGSTIGALFALVVVRLMGQVLSEPSWLSELLAGITAIVVLAVVTAFLTRQTHLELSKMRPVRPSEAWPGIRSFALRVFLGYVATIGVAVGLLVLLAHVPEWVERGVAGMNSTVAEALLAITWAMSVILAAFIFAVLLLSFLVPPILVVEECSVGDAIREWRALLREHRMRVMVYEGMALTLAFVAALPLLLPIELALKFGPAFSARQVGGIASIVPLLLQAFALGPALAFLAVANLFIYLNLRYEYTPQK